MEKEHQPEFSVLLPGRQEPNEKIMAWYLLVERLVEEMGI